jgi:hypothetical protein
MSLLRRLVVLAALIVSIGERCIAQTPAGDPRPTNNGVVLLTNIAIGAGTAAIGRVIAKKDPKKSALQGALAGAVIFAGKWLVAQNDDRSNLLGRTIAAVGSSEVREAATGKPYLAQVIIPYGIARLHVNRFSPRPLEIRLDLAATIATFVNACESPKQFQLAKSIKSGVPFFLIDRDKRGGSIKGLQLAGVVTYRVATRFEEQEEEQTKKMLGHELTHVVQSDYLFNAYGSLLEDTLVPRLPAGRTLHRFVDIGIHVPMLLSLNSVIPYADRPWEREAVTLSKQ